MHGPLAHEPTPIWRDMPRGQAMSCAYASATNPRHAIAAIIKSALFLIMSISLVLKFWSAEVAAASPAAPR